MAIHDVIIVGGGPAGLNAAIVLGRCRRNVLLCDSGVYRNITSHGLHFFLSRDGIPPEEFLRLSREELRAYPSVEYRKTTVLDVRQTPEHFEVRLKNGLQERSRKLLLATGVLDNLPELAGIQEFFGKSVFHCPYCDGWEVRDQALAIYGRGEKGKALALELTVWSRDLILCTDGPAELPPTDLNDLKRNEISVREDRIKKLEGDEGMLRRIVFEDGSSVERKAMFFSLGQRQHCELAAKLGCEISEKNAIRTGHNEKTNIPGLYIAGDASEALQFAVVAAAEGAKAAFAINTELREEDLK